MDHRTTWAEINLDNIEHNIREINRVKNKGSRVLAVVKANAYGHGSVQIARKLKSEGVDFFAVSSIYEAVELRENGIDDDILILGYTPKDHVSKALKYDVMMTIYSAEFARDVAALCKEMGVKGKAHIKIDTGMGRLGFQISEKSVKEIVEINGFEELEICGFFSHFATADELDKSFSQEQFDKFNEFLDRLSRNGVKVKNRHISNSAGIIDLPQYNLDIIRPGIMLYGYYPSGDVLKEKISLKKVMTLKTSVSNIKYIEERETVGYGRKFIANKKTKIATIPIGYADGFSRLLSNKIEVNIGKSRVKLVGNVCMDQSFLDCTECDSLNIGDEVVIFGEGENLNSAEDLAAAIGTISYEVLCMVGRRIPRVFIQDRAVFETVDYLL